MSASDKKKVDEVVAGHKPPDVSTPVSYFKLYSLAEPLDYFLIALGTIGAVVNGITMPLFTLVFGKLINTYGDPDTSSLEKTINDIALDFVYLAIAAFFGSFLEVSMFVWSGSLPILYRKYSF